MSLRVAILAHGFVPQYRLRLYELLNARQGAEYVIFHGTPPFDVGSRAAEEPFPFPEKRVENHEFRIGGWSVVYQPVIRAILSGNYDAVVLGHEIRFISNVFLALMCKLSGIAVLYWGFGYHYDLRFGADLDDKSKGWRVRIVAALKGVLTRLADGYLAYTRDGVEKLVKTGFARDHIYILQNTIDVAGQIKLHEALKRVTHGAIRAQCQLRPDSVVFLFIGRLISLKGADMLIEALKRIGARKRSSQFVETLIVGAGPEEERLKAMAKEVPGVRFLGELPPGEEVARYMKVAAAVIIPGGVGLASVHAFAHGRPMITRQHRMHGPEVNYITHNENGLIIEGGIDEFAEELARFANSPDWQQRLADGALRARDEFRIERMAERFDEAVQLTVAQIHRRHIAPAGTR